MPYSTVNRLWHSQLPVNEVLKVWVSFLTEEKWLLYALKIRDGSNEEA